MAAPPARILAEEYTHDIRRRLTNALAGKVGLHRLPTETDDELRARAIARIRSRERFDQIWGEVVAEVKP